jgi:hypothetical protein
MISGTAGSQDIQQFIRFFDPDTAHHARAAFKQGLGQHTGRGPDNGDFGIRPGGF